MLIQNQAIFIKQSSRAEAFVEHFIRPVELLIGKENAKRSDRQAGNVDKKSIDWQQYHNLDDPPPRLLFVVKHFRGSLFDQEVEQINEESHKSDVVYH